jgi:hypothetical protein
MPKTFCRPFGAPEWGGAPSPAAYAAG